MTSVVRKNVQYPRKYSVYKHYTTDGLIYVGSGWSSRPWDVVSRSAIWKSTVNGKIICIEIVDQFDDVRSARLAERKLIERLQPPANLAYTYRHDTRSRRKGRQFKHRIATRKRK